MGRVPGPRPQGVPRSRSGRPGRGGAGLTRRSRREVTAEELRQFCSRVSALLQKEDLGPEAVDALRRLFLIVSATKYGRR